MVKFSEAVKNARANATESAIGASPVMEIRSGAAPADVTTADSGDLLVSIQLPADWLTAAAAGVVSKSGAWSAAATAAGSAGHFRIKQGATCHMQGSVTATGGGGDLQLVNTSIAAGQNVSIDSASMTESY
jgi:hypothetical protein